MTILTIIAKEPKTRIQLSKPMWIRGIQLIDYSFNTFHNVFSKDQTFERNGTVLATFLKGVPFTFLDIIGVINHGIVGISIHTLGNQIHIRNTISSSMLTFSDELRKALNVCRLLPLGANFCVSETQDDYHIRLKGMNLGLVTKEGKTIPSDLLVALPSKSTFFPLHTIEMKLYDYLDLEITTHYGKDVNFHDKPYRIVLLVEDSI